MKFFTSKTKKLPPAARKGLLPRKEFMTQGRENFLAAFDTSPLATNARPAPRPYLTIFFKAGIGVVAALCVAVGVSAYADTANVPATSPLYPLKRLSENVQVALAPTSEKAQLQATFAVRRANEIVALQASAPSSTLIPKLTSDLDREISSSLGDGRTAGAGDNSHSYGRGNGNGGAATEATSTSTSTPTSTASPSVDTGMIKVYCAAFTMSTSGVLIGRLENNLALHPNALAQFNAQCGSDTLPGVTATSSRGRSRTNGSMSF
jgi:hypothetical protein